MKQAPQFLKAPTRGWMNALLKTYDLEERHVRVLALAGQAWDRCAEIRTILTREGYQVRDRFEQTQVHPLMGEERAQARLFAGLMRELGLDLAADAEPLRMPRPQAKKGKEVIWNASKKTQSA